MGGWGEDLSRGSGIRKSGKIIRRVLGICARTHFEDYTPSSYRISSDSKKLITLEMKKYRSINNGSVWTLGL